MAVKAGVLCRTFPAVWAVSPAPCFSVLRSGLFGAGGLSFVLYWLLDGFINHFEGGIPCCPMELH